MDDTHSVDDQRFSTSKSGATCRRCGEAVSADATTCNNCAVTPDDRERAGLPTKADALTDVQGPEEVSRPLHSVVRGIKRRGRSLSPAGKAAVLVLTVAACIALTLPTPNGRQDASSSAMAHPTWNGERINNAGQFLKDKEAQLAAIAVGTGAVPSADMACYFVSQRSYVPNAESAARDQLPASDIYPSATCGPFLLRGQSSPTPAWVSVAFIAQVQADAPDSGYTLSSNIDIDDISRYSSVFRPTEKGVRSSEEPLSAGYPDPSMARPNGKRPPAAGQFTMSKSSAVMLRWNPPLTLDQPRDKEFPLVASIAGTGTVNVLGDGTSRIDAANGQQLVAMRIDQLASTTADDSHLDLVDGKTTFPLDDALSDVSKGILIMSVDSADKAVLRLTAAGRTFDYRVATGTFSDDTAPNLTAPVMNATGGAGSEQIVGEAYGYGDTAPQPFELVATTTGSTAALLDDKGWARPQ